MNEADAEVTFNAEFLFPVLFPFFFRVLFQNDHFRQLCDSAIGPAPGDAFYAPADFPEDPFQQRGGFRSDYAGLQPQFDVGKDTLGEVFQVGGAFLIAVFFEDVDQFSNLRLAGSIFVFDRMFVLFF